MSKQIAQTVGDKKLAALIALLAAFAVLATLAGQWQKSDAAVTAADYDLSAPGTLCTGSVPIGTVCSYRIDIGPITANSVGTVQFGARLDPLIGNITNIDTSGFTGLQAGNCFVTGQNGGTNNRIDCTITPQALVGASGFITFDAIGLAPGVLAANAQSDLCFAVDNGVVSSATCATNVTPAVTFQSAVISTFTKADAPDPVTPGNSVTYTISIANTGPIGATGTVTDTLPSSAFASVTSATTTSGSCSISSLTVTCSNIALPATTGTATITIVGLTKANPGIPSFTNTANLTTVVNGLTGPSASAPQTTSFVNGATTGLVHVSATGAIESIRDHENNVIGYTHTVCALNDAVNAIWPNIVANDQSDNFQIVTISGTANVQTPVATANVDCDGDGFPDDSRLTWYSTAPGEQNVTVVDDGGNTLYGWQDGGTPETGAATVPLVKEWNTLAPTWITSSSTSPVTQGTPDTLTGTNLDGAVITTGSMTFNATNGTYTGTSSTYYEYPIATHTNAAGTQLYVAYGAKVTITRASSSTCGAVVLGGTAGVEYVYVSGPTTLDDSADVLVVTSLGVGIPFRFEAGTGVDPCTSVTGNTKVNIQVDYPRLLGSDQPPAPALESLQINWTGALPYKKVFLAWAGQRIILEQDWRLPAGDVDDASTTEPGPVGVCPWGARTQGSWSFFDVNYIKGGGPGNFVDGLNDNAGATDLQKGRVVLNGSDQATVYNIDANDALQDNTSTGSDDVPLGPQDSCISRVLYESEDPGEVDIEAFVTSVSDTVWPAVGERVPVLNNSTKVAFVVYYMKINTVNISLVTQVAKPSHNSSVLADYAPGNPWDASKDDADNAADWNVSKDLLVRGRVTGWFLNSNPSGRAADTSNPLNVLPANRWVMPNDWPLLAGGPADPADGSDAIGTAEQFRPYYDIMFAPNNARKLALGTPTGQGTAVGIQLTTVATGNTGTGRFVASGNIANSPIRVTSCADLPALRSIYVGTAGPSSVLACASGFLFISPSLATAPAAGTPIYLTSGVPFEGPFSPLDILGWAAEGKGGAALSNIDIDNIRDTAVDDGDVDMWDAPMPPAAASVAIRGTGFLKMVLKDEVYYEGVPNTVLQTYPNPFYYSNIPDSPFIPATVAGGGFLWDSWGNDGPGGNGDGAYHFWWPALVGTNSQGIGETLSTTDQAELSLLRTYFQDFSIARDLVVFTDNHGEFMVTANGDFKTDLTACATNVLSGGKHCKTGDKVGTGSITATVDYPDFDKHFPVLSNVATATWLWVGYKDVTVENGETDQYKYIVFHAMDRDGFCSPLGTGAVSLHSVLGRHSLYTDSSIVFDDVDTDFSALGTRYNGDPIENVDFLIDSGEGIIIGSSGSPSATSINDGKQFATNINTFSVSENDPATTGIKEFPLSSLAASGQTDECQAWIKVSNSLLGILNVLAIAHDDEGNIGFDKIIDLTNTTSYTLNFRWSLITWAGADSITVSDAIKGTGTSGKNPGGNDISASVTAIYGWDAAAQQWLGYFPSGVNVPGANDLTALKTGQAYWIAITGPSSVTWTIASNVN